MKGIYVLAAVVTVVLVLLIAGRLYTSNVAFNVGNPYGNGFSQFYSGSGVSAIYRLSDLPAGYSMDTMLLIVNPTYRYRSGDAATIEAYMSKGGNVVIIDNFGEADGLLTLLNSSIRILPVSVCDENNWNNPAEPLITNISGSGITGNLKEIYAKNPASLIVSGPAMALAFSSNQSWLDTNNNATKELSERYGSYAIIASEPVGGGSLTVIADPDIFTNDLVGKGDNRKLAAGIFNRKTVFLDLSHGPPAPGLMSAINTIRFNLVAQILLLAVAMLIAFIYLLLVISRYPVFIDEVARGVPKEKEIAGNAELINQVQSEQTGKN